MTDRITAELGTIREMAAQITGDHAIADCTADLGARCTGHDAQRLADAIDAVLALADDWAAPGPPPRGEGERAQRYCGIRLRAVIKEKLLAKDGA